MSKSIYILISQTNTRFGKLIRKFGKIQYNHASIALDSELSEIYSFARQRHSLVLTGKLVKENISRFTLNRATNINATIFEVPVTEEQYDEIKALIEEIYNDKEYLYNLFSVLTYPLTKGLSVYKAFTCNEFAMYVLKLLGHEVQKPLYQYKPDDLLEILGDKIYYQGNLLEYVKEKKVKTDYFDGIRMIDIHDSIMCISKLLFRTITLKKNNLY